MSLDQGGKDLGLVSLVLVIIQLVRMQTDMNNDEELDDNNTAARYAIIRWKVRVLLVAACSGVVIPDPLVSFLPEIEIVLLIPWGEIQLLWQQTWTRKGIKGRRNRRRNK